MNDKPGDKIIIEPVNFGGWSHNIRISNGRTEAIVTLDVGPRIIRFARVGGENVFKEVTAELGKSGEAIWVSRGGHRLWTAPEEPQRTYAPDNGPVKHVVDGKKLHATTPADDRTGLERTLSVGFADDGEALQVGHVVKNRGSASVQIAAWALTVMAPGGCAIVPLPPFHAHPGAGAPGAEDFAPGLSMAFWSYFRFPDPRFSFGEKFLQVRHDAALPPTKIGLAHAQGWVGYLRNRMLFVKTVPWDAGAPYPDRGCNFETYTDQGILELETLGPFTTVEPGQEIMHDEAWCLLDGIAPAANDDGIERDIVPLVHAALP